jgi:molecular chaperone Hsp33
MITLDQSIQDAVQHQCLPPGIQSLLAEFLSGAGLLAGVLKFEGLLTLQIRGDGELPLIMAEATHQRQLRGIIKFAKDASDQTLYKPFVDGKTLRELVGNGVLTLTIDPEKGSRYQGVVPLEGDSIADCLSHYFSQSEQLPTRLWLFSDGAMAGGFFMQSLPASSASKKSSDSDLNPGQEDWHTLVTLANTLTSQESLELSHPEQLHRLFHEFQLHIAGNLPVQFACRCSQERSENALVALGKQDALMLLEEKGHIAIDCDFCGRSYQLVRSDLDRVFDLATLLH